MRDHGVPNFPTRAAVAALVSTTPGSHPASEQQKSQMVALSERMRRHGVTGFADPTTKQSGDVQKDMVCLALSVIDLSKDGRSE
jgi:hypothetical protein